MDRVGSKSEIMYVNNKVLWISDCAKLISLHPLLVTQQLWICV